MSIFVCLAAPFFRHVPCGAVTGEISGMDSGGLTPVPAAFPCAADRAGR